MFTYEEKMKAIQLLIKYDISYTAVVKEIGYPSVNGLRKWYREYLNTGSIHEKYNKKSKYSDDQKRLAVNHYKEHGKCISRTCRKLGYPCRDVLKQWIKELEPELASCRSYTSGIRYTQKEKESAVIALCSRQTSAEEVAKAYATSRMSLYNWKNKSVGKGITAMVKKKTQDETSNTIEENEALRIERDQLLLEIHKLQIERDILEKAAEIIKKDEGISLDNLSNREKTIVIGALIEKYTLKELLDKYTVLTQSLIS